MMQGSSHSLPSVPLLDVQRENLPLRDEILTAIARVFDTGRFLYGPDVERLERSIAALCQTKHAIGCASGSDALLLALMAHQIGPGDQVIVPSFTFFATASAVWRLGAEIVFADIEPNTFNLSPPSVEAAITPSTRAIIPVHLYGQCAEMDRIMEIARKHKLIVIEDGCQAIGATFADQPAGSWGPVGCFSFYPTKNLGGLGDGGMLTCNEDALAARLRSLAAHGMQPRYFHSMVGINSRLDSLQAAALNVKIRHLQHATQLRYQNASYYFELFSRCHLSDQITVPHVHPASGHVWNQFTIRVAGGRRDALWQYLQRRNIGTEVYYPVPLHRQECFSGLGYPQDSLPETERAADEVLSLPIFPEITSQEQESVVRAIADFFDQRQISAA